DFNPKWHWSSGFVSSETLLVIPAILANTLLMKDGSFDVRFIGIIHSAVFLTAFWLFAPLIENTNRRLRFIIYGAAVLIFCDAMYVTPLNSFYMDESPYLFLLLSVALYLRVMRWHSPRDVFFLGLALLLLVTAKTQHAVIGLWIAL